MTVRLRNMVRKRQMTAELNPYYPSNPCGNSTRGPAPRRDGKGGWCNRLSLQQQAAEPPKGNDTAGNSKPLANSGIEI